MPTTTLSSREFNQEVNRAKKAANDGPVIITDRGRPSHVLMSFEEYKRLQGGREKLGDSLSMPANDDIEFEAPRILEYPRGADFT